MEIEIQDLSRDPADRRLEVGAGRAAVWLHLTEQGRDLVLRIGGGDAHVGAVATVSPAGGTAGEACEELAVVPGHKEGPLALAAARRLAAAGRRTCVCVAGIHQDAITPAEIAAVLAHVEAGVERLAEGLEVL
ncbi:MAG TPA: hypothetical protein P5571_07330 [Candidatus Krumholzibacteria bacterium]|nr:hypothetical protein [Candidatus Krumholzibacteria bacterium]HRX51153.1 hypothetical protein [Candidatus Krumholzibacteria bacterium]